MSPRVYERTVPSAPFAKWLQAQLDQGWTDRRLAAHLGIPERRLYDYKNQLSGKKGRGNGTHPTDTFERQTVERVLRQVGLLLEDLYPPEGYPELYPEVVLEPDVWCDKCGEMTTPMRGMCLWCDTIVRKEAA